MSNREIRAAAGAAGAVLERRRTRRARIDAAGIVLSFGGVRAIDGLDLDDRSPARCTA